MKKITKWMMICLVLFTLTGCWDQRQFKNIKLVLAAGFDQVDDDKIKSTVIIPTVEKGMEGPGNEYIQTVTTESNTLREGRTQIDQKISKIFDASKIRVILLGEELAKKDILPLLDVFYRDPKSNLNAMLAVVEGEAEDIINLRVDHEPRISGYISGLLKGQVKLTQAPVENIQLICAEMMEPGQDFGLPVISLNEEEGLINYEGIGLFHGQKYTGKSLDPRESLLLLLLNGQKGKMARLSAKVNSDQEPAVKNYVSFDVRNIKQKIEIEKKEQIEVSVKLKLKVGITEYPHDHITPPSLKELEKKLSKLLTADAADVVKKIQEANSDVFGIGRRLQAYHNKEWKQLNWEEDYPEINITPDVKVNIEEHGIIN